MDKDFINPAKIKKDIELESFNVMSLYKNVTKEMSDAESKIHAEELCVKYIKKRFDVISIHGNENEAWCKINNIYSDVGRTVIDQYLRKVFNGNYSKPIFSKILTKTIADNYKHPKEFFSNINVFQIPLKNGVFDLEKNKLISYSECDKYFFNKIMFNYNENAKCPKFIKFLTEVLKKGEDDVMMMQEAVGNILLGDYRFQKAVIMMGKGGNGKGVFMEVLQKIFSGMSSSLDLSQITKKGDNFEIASLFGKWLNISGDIGKKDFLEDTGMFKKLTGEDYIEAQRKKTSGILFKNRAKLFLACNELPHTSDSSDGFFRRWMYFEFDKTFIDNDNYIADGGEIEIDGLKSNVFKRNVNLKKELKTKQELEGIIKWMIDGVIRLLKNGKFSESRTQNKLRRLWKRNSDPLGCFTDEHIDIDNESFITKEEFKKRLSEFNPSVRVSDNNITYYLKREFNVQVSRKRINGKHMRIWKGITFMNESKHEGINVFEDVKNG